jgi:hypothetical protein
MAHGQDGWRRDCQSKVGRRGCNRMCVLTRCRVTLMAGSSSTHGVGRAVPGSCYKFRIVRNLGVQRGTVVNCPRWVLPEIDGVLPNQRPQCGSVSIRISTHLQRIMFMFIWLPSCPSWSLVLIGSMTCRIGRRRRAETVACCEERHTR